MSFDFEQSHKSCSVRKLNENPHTYHTHVQQENRKQIEQIEVVFPEPELQSPNSKPK